MARSFNGSSQYLSGSTASPPSAPASFSIWAMATAHPYAVALQACVNASNSLLALYMRGSNGHVGFWANNAGAGSTIADSGVLIDDGKWHHLAGTWDGTTATVYVDGTATTASGAQTLGSLTTLAIGGDLSANAPGLWPGSLAEAAIWNALLTASEVKALASGVNARSLRSGALKAYWPVWGLHNPEPDMSGNAQNMTLNGAPPQSSHAPVTLFTRKAPAMYSVPTLGGRVLLPLVARPREVVAPRRPAWIGHAVRAAQLVPRRILLPLLVPAHVAYRVIARVFSWIGQRPLYLPAPTLPRRILNRRASVGNVISRKASVSTAHQRKASVGTLLSRRASEMSVASNFQLFMGEDVEIDFTLVPPQDMTGWTLTSSVSATLGGAVIFNPTVTITDAGRGLFKVVWPRSSTENLTPGDYVWDVRRTDSGKNTVLAHGEATCKQPVTT